VKIEGLNGQLPNLDLVNLVHRMCSKEGIRHTFKNRVSMFNFFPSVYQASMIIAYFKTKTKLV